MQNHSSLQNYNRICLAQVIKTIEIIDIYKEKIRTDSFVTIIFLNPFFPSGLHRTFYENKKNSTWTRI